jgi:hypothetical protein
MALLQRVKAATPAADFSIRGSIEPDPIISKFPPSLDFSSASDTSPHPVDCGFFDSQPVMPSL